jgi:hypothetical protein
VQPFPSSQAAPSVFAGLEQAPVAGLQAPARWHWSEAGQARAAPPMQVPALHASPSVHALPSSQVAPLALAGLEQDPVAGSQTPGR